MNIKQLKEILKKYPDEMAVLVEGYESGYDDIAQIQIKLLAIDPTGGGCEGKYEEIRRPHSNNPNVKFEALILER